MFGEFFDIVDAKDRVIGQAPRHVAHRDKLWHRAVHIFLFNEKGELFLQLRAPNKDTFPDCYDSSASGHLDAGEEYDACAVRELEEELGLIVPARSLRKHFKLPASEQTGWEFVWVYSLHGNHSPVINPSEITTGRFYPAPEIEALIAAKPERCTPAFCLVWREYVHRVR